MEYFIRTVQLVASFFVQVAKTDYERFEEIPSEQLGEAASLISTLCFTEAGNMKFVKWGISSVG